MLFDLNYIFLWWLTFFGLGIIFFPLTKKFFGNFFDQGYLFSKVLGILLSSYFVWLLASFRILPFGQLTIWIVLIFGLLINLLLFHKKIRAFSFFSPTNPSDSKPFSRTLLIFVFEELMFLAALVFWSFIRGFQPDIQGLEKFMDFGFVNSILRSKYFPPADIWFAGKSINYYYFGHYVTAFLSKLSGIDSAVTYNLMIATLFSFTFSLTFSLTGNLVYFFFLNKFERLKIDLRLKIKNANLVVISGLISALLISLGANLHPAYYNLKMDVLKKPYCDGSFTYWYPNATRYIGYCPDVEDKTIHEFPSYSFIVSDLHGHVSDIPFVLLFLALSLNFMLFLKEKRKSFPRASLFGFSGLSSLILAVMFMTNQWDYPIYLMVLGLTILWSFFERQGFTWKAFLRAGILGAAIVLLSAVFFLPFQLGFDPIAKGIGFVRAHSLPHQLLILWGAPLFFGLIFLIFLFGKKIKQALSVRLLRSLRGQSDSSYFSSDKYVLILFFVAAVLIIIPEIIYVKDIYIPSYHRANTMFKLTYQSFIMFSIGIGYIFVRILSSLQNNFSKKIFFVFGSVLITSLMFYPLYSIPGYYGRLNTKDYKGIYGLQFMQRLYPDDYRAIAWLNKNVPGQPNVLEAVGDSYTDYERISMATGLPTIEGWLVHEWLWRGSYDEPGKRSTEVQTIYEAKDINQTKELLKKYHIKYLVVGEMERQKYPNIDENNLKKLGTKVFESGSTVIYELL